MTEQLLDQFTRVDEKMTKVVDRLNALVESEGTAHVASPTSPFGTIGVPEETPRLGIPPGNTKFDFTQGRVESTEAEDSLILGGLKTIGDLSTQTSSLDNRLRSLSIYVDSPVNITIGGTKSATLEGGTYNTFPSLNYDTVRLECNYPTEVRLVAGARADPVTTEISGTTQERFGSRAEDVYDTWEEIFWTSPWLYDKFGAYALNENNSKHNYHASFNRATYKIKNNTASDGKIDARLVAKDNPEVDSGWNDWYEIDRINGVEAGDSAVFTVSEAHHRIKPQFQNSAVGTSVGAGGTLIAQNV